MANSPAYARFFLTQERTVTDTEGRVPNLVTLNVGLIKPRKGFPPITDKEKPGGRWRITP